MATTSGFCSDVSPNNNTRIHTRISSPNIILAWLCVCVCSRQTQHIFTGVKIHVDLSIRNWISADCPCTSVSFERATVLIELPFSQLGRASWRERVCQYV